MDSLRSVGATGVVGVRWSPIPALTLGASAKVGLFGFGGSGRFSILNRYLGAPEGIPESASSIVDGEYLDVALPDMPELRAGVALELGRLELRADLLYTFSGSATIGHLSATINNFASNDIPNFDRHEKDLRLLMVHAVNVSAGARFSFTPSWSASLGFLTDRSSSPAYAEPGEGIRWPREDRYYGTTGVSYQSGAFSIHGGLAAGASRFSSSDFLFEGDEGHRLGFSMRLFLAGGVNAKDVLRAF
jgi:hypothetical protein